MKNFKLSKLLNNDDDWNEMQRIIDQKMIHQQIWKSIVSLIHFSASIQFTSALFSLFASFIWNIQKFTQLLVYKFIIFSFKSSSRFSILIQFIFISFASSASFVQDIQESACKLIIFFFQFLFLFKFLFKFSASSF